MSRWDRIVRRLAIIGLMLGCPIGLLYILVNVAANQDKRPSPSAYLYRHRSIMAGRITDFVKSTLEADPSHFIKGTGYIAAQRIKSPYPTMEEVQKILGNADVQEDSGPDTRHLIWAAGDGYKSNYKALECPELYATFTKDAAHYVLDSLRACDEIVKCACEYFGRSGAFYQGTEQTYRRFLLDNAPFRGPKRIDPGFPVL